LEKTDLVLLSACETGLGDIKNGEGVYGLQRAFQLAGARTLIISLWKLSDEATQELMANFYRNWTATGNKVQSFKTAQQSLKTKFPNPYFWGAFIMISN
jgi:CHAT domain-containing protein